SCPDWPLCFGKPFTFPDFGAILEQSHRWTASIVSLLILALAVCIFLWGRKQRRLLIPMLLAGGLLIVQIILGGLTVLWKLPPEIITAHLATALAIFAMILTIAVFSGKATPATEAPQQTRKFVRLSTINALLVYGLLLTGSYVTGHGASL